QHAAMPPIADALFDAVPALLDEAAQRFVMPRFGALQQADVEEKSRGELVTVADREAEAFLAPRLAALLPGSRVVGEEAASADASLLQSLDQGRVWLVDPVDSTSNFVAGRPVFALMAALLQDGEAIGAWVLQPVRGERWRAQRGGGTWCDGRRVMAAAEPLAPAGLRGAVLTRYLPDGLRTQIEARTGRIGHCLPGLGCAGEEYPAIIAGHQHFAMFWRTLPWDHVPGALLVEEAGGWVARLDGMPYRAGDTAY